MRSTHLTAHSRSHMDDSMRPCRCPHAGCEKRFWTQQHVRRHVLSCHTMDAGQHAVSAQHAHDMLGIERGQPLSVLYRCESPGCDLLFFKRKYLRTRTAQNTPSYASMRDVARGSRQTPSADTMRGFMKKGGTGAFFHIPCRRHQTTLLIRSNVICRAGLSRPGHTCNGTCVCATHLHAACVVDHMPLAISSSGMLLCTMPPAPLCRPPSRSMWPNGRVPGMDASMYF